MNAVEEADSFLKEEAAGFTPRASLGEGHHTLHEMDGGNRIVTNATLARYRGAGTLHTDDTMLRRQVPRASTKSRALAARATRLGDLELLSRASVHVKWVVLEWLVTPLRRVHLIFAHSWVFGMFGVSTRTELAKHASLFNWEDSNHVALFLF